MLKHLKLSRAISELANDKTERIPKAAINKIAEELDAVDIRELIDFKNKD